MKKFFSDSSKAWFCLSAIFFYLLLKLFHTDETISKIPLQLVLLVFAPLAIYPLIEKLRRGDFAGDLLAAISIVTAILLDELLAATIVVLMLSGGRALEEYATNKASQVLSALAKRAPSIAHKKKGETVVDIKVDAIRVLDELIVYPHEICPADGEVVRGDGVMDESYLTGEPFMISKAPGSRVLSGAINGDNALEIKAIKTSKDSRFERIMQVITETEQKKTQLRRLGDTLGTYYTPLALFIALLAFGLTGDPTRFLATLVIATPCPLLIGIPVAVMGSISLAASFGIIIKNPSVLETFATCKTMIFDKTGTLTYGKPQLVNTVVFPPFDPKEILQLVASLEKFSKHPLGPPLVLEAEKENIPLLTPSHIEEKPGRGLNGEVLNHTVFITSRKEAKKKGFEKELEGVIPDGLECVLIVDEKVAAIFQFHDEPRGDVRTFVDQLKQRHGFIRTMIISGDRGEEVQYVANHVGISEVYAGVSPEGKVKLVEEVAKMGKTAYLGDGINDAPALLAATVGIAFGQNSDITAEAAGAVIMDSSFKKVDTFLHISKRMRTIALESAIFGMSLSLVGMGFAAFGYLTPVAGALLQEGIDVLSILNSLRTLYRPKPISDMEL